MNEKTIQELDPNFESRAGQLVDDAIKDAMANSHGAQAFKGYLQNASFMGKLGFLASKSGINLAQALASAAIITAGVSSSVVTLGIGPVIGLILSGVVDKASTEAKYQLKTKALREGVTHSTQGDSIADPALLEPGMAKIMRKLDRVLRRRDQLAGGAGGVWAKVRHARTAFRAWREGDVAPGQGFPGYFKDGDEATHDKEINQRLFELHYYAQMLGNYAASVLDALIRERDNYEEYAELIYAHVVRQVHISGNHTRCFSCCYSAKESEVRQRIDQAVALLASQPGQAQAFAGAGHAMASQREVPPRIGSTENLATNIRLAQGEIPPADDAPWHAPVTGKVKQYATRSGDEKDVELRAKAAANLAASKGATLLMQDVAQHGVLPKTGEAWKANIPGLDRQVTVDQYRRGVVTAPAAVAQAAVSVVSAGVTLFAEELAATARNRLIKRAVLKKRNRVFKLLEAQMASQEEAVQALKEIAKGKDILSRSDRVAQKVAWYIGKIERVEGEFKDLLRKLGPNYEHSAFATCRDAWNMVRALHYVFKQYEKAIVFLVYLDVILVEMDAKAAKELRMPTGMLYDPGMPDPARPRHMTAVELDSPLLELAEAHLDAEPEPPAPPDLDDLLGEPARPAADEIDLDDLLKPATPEALKMRPLFGPHGTPPSLHDDLLGEAPRRTNPLRKPGEDDLL